MKTVFLIDSLWGGHHPTYIKFFAKILLELGNRVVVFCPDPNEVSDWLMENSPSFLGKFYTFKIQEPASSKVGVLKMELAVSAKNRWKIARQAIESAISEINFPPDLVFFAWLDTYLGPYLTHSWVDQVFPYNWSGLYFHIHHLRRKRQLLPLRRGLLNPESVLQSSRCQSVAVLDEGVAPELQQRLLGKPVVVFPDFADDSPPEPNYLIAKEIQEKANNRKIIGLLGSLSKRKGLLTLIDIAQQPINQNFFFVFAGQLSNYDLNKQELAKIYKTINLKLPNCFFYLEKIPDESHFNALVNICDVLFAAYHKFPSSSNILTKAAIFHKPVIVSKGYCLEERVKKYNLGLSIREGSVKEGSDAISHLCNLPANQKNFKPMFEEYRLMHSYRQLYLCFNSIIEKLSINVLIKNPKKKKT